jgi:hypothetical protein
MGDHVCRNDRRHGHELRVDPHDIAFIDFLSEELFSAAGSAGCCSFDSHRPCAALLLVDSAS